MRRSSGRFSRHRVRQKGHQVQERRLDIFPADGGLSVSRTHGALYSRSTSHWLQKGNQQTIDHIALSTHKLGSRRTFLLRYRRTMRGYLSSIHHRPKASSSTRIAMVVHSGRLVAAMSWDRMQQDLHMHLWSSGRRHRWYW